MMRQSCLAFFYRIQLTSLLFHVESKQSGLIVIIFPLLTLIHLSDQQLYNFTYILLRFMEDQLRPLLKRQKSSITIASLVKKQFTSPRIEQFQRTANRYKNYLGGLNSKIDKICQKEQYRNYLKGQKLNTIKNKLEDKKNQLQKVLEDKRDPIKSPNGKIYAQILSLQKLEASYSEILEKLTKSLQQKKQVINQLVNTVNQQKTSIKQNLKQSFCETLKNKDTLVRNKSKILNKTSLQSVDSSYSYQSRSRQSMLSKLGNFWQAQAKERIDQQEQKIIILRLFCVFAKSSQIGSKDISNSILQLVQRQLKVKNELLFEVKQIMNKQDKKSLHGD